MSATCVNRVEGLFEQLAYMRSGATHFQFSFDSDFSVGDEASVAPALKFE